MRERLKLLIQGFLNPRRKPEAAEHLDRRLDDVDRRLERVLSGDGANQAQRVVRESGRRG